MTEREIRLECLKLVMPQSGNPDPAHYIAKAETLLTWIMAGEDNAPSTLTTPAERARVKKSEISPKAYGRIET